MPEYPLINVLLNDDYDGRELRWCFYKTGQLLDQLVGNLYPKILVARMDEMRLLYYRRYGRRIDHVGPPPPGGYWDRHG